MILTSLTMLAHRPISSYEEFVHEPMRPTLISLGQLFFLAVSPNLEIGWARSGVKGPLTWGSKVERSNSMSWKVSHFKICTNLSINYDAICEKYIHYLIVRCVRIGCQKILVLVSFLCNAIPVGCFQILLHSWVVWEKLQTFRFIIWNVKQAFTRKYKIFTLVVAPISAPMLQIVAMPVQEIVSTPGPWYSTMAPVPPFTVNIPATLRMISLGLAHPWSFPITDIHRIKLLFCDIGKITHINYTNNE